MRGQDRQGLSWLALAWLALAWLALACSCSREDPSTAVDPATGVVKTAASVRAARRAFDGAPPVIPHQPNGAACVSCHNDRGMEVPGLGFAPPSPHRHTAAPSSMSRCEQCHVYALTDQVFRGNEFVGLAQDLRRGPRLNPLAPPVIPHQILLRENCAACHDGPAAREEIRCPHPERVRCLQCHVPVVSTGRFSRDG